MIIEWSGILFIITILFFALLIVKFSEKKFSLNSEIKRKLFHMMMGLAMITFPFIFESIYSVATLGIIALVVLFILKTTKLNKSLGTVLYSVDRESFGEIFFVISVFLIFYLSKGDKVLYTIPILVLTFADSIAALAGSNYGKQNLAKQNEDAKSLEGSFMFFMTAFMATLVPLLLYTTVGREEILFISAIIGFNVALVEMFSHTGNDNLLIPLTTYAFLASHINLDVAGLKTNLWILVIIFVLVRIVSRITSKIKIWSKLALVETLVIGYLIVILYGFYAIIPPLMLFLTSLIFPKPTEEEKKNIYDARIVETNGVVGMAICAIAAMTELKSEFFLIYVLAFSIQLSINSFIRFKYYVKLSEIDSLLLAFAKGFAFVYLPGFFIQKLVFNTYPSMIMMVLSIVLLMSSCVIISIIKKNVETEEFTLKNAYMYMKIVAVLIAVITIIQLVLTNHLLIYRGEIWNLI